MTVRNIKKSLAGVEDIATGIGTLAQERGTVHRVNVFPSSYSYIDMQRYEDGDFFRLYGSDLSYTDYRRNSAGTVGIPAGAGGVWEPLTSNDKLIGGNTVDGAYLVDATYLVWHAATGSNYAWTGPFPKVVAPGTDPAAIAGFVMRSDAWLRADLASESGSELVGYQLVGTGAVATTVQSKLREFVSVKDFGAVADGMADDTAAIQNAIDAVYAGSIQGGSVYLPKGVYKVTSSIYQKPRVSIFGDGSRKSQIVWGASDLTSYQNGVVFCVAGSDAAPDFVFSTCIEGVSISGGGYAPVALAIRGHQENCRFVEITLSGFTYAGLEALPFSSVNHAITFSDLHIIPHPGATNAYGMRLSNVQKCVFDNITIDVSRPNYYEYGIYMYNTPILNVFRAIHTEDCRYGIYLLGGANNVFIGLEAINNTANGVCHFYTTSSRHTIHAMRTVLGFTNHYQDASRNITAGTATDSVTIERGANYFRRLTDSETYIGTTASTVTLGSPRLTRGVDSYAGTSGEGQTYLRVNTSIAASSTQYVEINIGAGAVGFAGKLRLFSTGDQRYATEVMFAGYANDSGGVSGGAVSAQVGTNTTLLSITAPEALATPQVGKIRIPVQNSNASFAQVLEVLVEITVRGRQALGIAVTS